MKSLTLSFALAALWLGSLGSQPAAAQTKIGVVDMQRALAETEDGRKAKETLKKLFDQRQKTLDKQQDEIKTLKDNVEKQRDVLSREEIGRAHV